MTWFKMDDRFMEDDKVIGLSAEALKLHLLALCWCSRNYETEGTFRKLAVSERFNGKPRRVSELLDAGLWLENGDVFEINNWLKYQRSAKQISAERERSRIRKARSRAGSHGVTPSEVPRPETEAETETELLLSTPPIPKRGATPPVENRADHSNTKPMTAERVSELGVVLPDLPTDQQVKSLPELRKRRGSAA